MRSLCWPRLTGPMAPKDWRGALAISYHVGPGAAKVHLKVSFNWDIKPVYDVIAKIPGAERPDAWVIRGNHHDAWVNGAEDPTSGQVTLLEEARAFGELTKQGWKPKRTIIYCAWDGEEPMLLGSTEWAEEHDKELEQHAVAYINSDGNIRGYLDMNGSHTLEHFVNGVARDIRRPGDEAIDRGEACACGESNRPRPPKIGRKSASGPTFARRPWAPARITPLSSTIWGSPRST